MTTSAFHTELAALVPRLRRLAAVLVPQAEAGDALVQAVVQHALAALASRRADGPLDLTLFGLLAQQWLALAGASERAPAELANGSADLAIRQALAMLPARQRLVVALVLVEGLRYQQAASVLGVPLAVIGDELACARQALGAVLPGHARSVP
ncbi:sigma factor-like helix-turn-helix DNA-binding protein [Massilia sp. PWRC2]|uniref:sigma factor-like helix-turn-helix DNA-binding protein n=1 Tax=Massilia sp. PWRC2 TaxID=2804626 RepID=UPI003CF15B45